LSEQRAKKRFAPIQAESEQRMVEQKRESTPTIFLVMSTCGLASGATETKQAFEEALSEKSIEARIVPVGCLGHCYAEPLVIIDHPTAGFPPICYYQINADRARILVRSYLEEGDPVLKYVLGAMEENDLIPAVMDFPRFSLEQRLVMEHCGLIDPDDIHQYIARGGYSGLVKALDSAPHEVINLIEASGLREMPRQMESLLFATVTKGTRAPTWIVLFWKAIHTSCWKVLPSVPMQWEPVKPLSMSEPSIPLP